MYRGIRAKEMGMKKIFSGLVAISIFLPMAGAGAANSREDIAIQAFDRLLTSGSNEEAAAQVRRLSERGFTVREATDAVVLGGSCGVVGCDSTVLVTTPFRSAGANTRRTVIAAVVYVPAGRPEATVRRILMREELSNLSAR
jgi:hypothetical protein